MLAHSEQRRPQVRSGVQSDGAHLKVRIKKQMRRAAKSLLRAALATCSASAHSASVARRCRNSATFSRISGVLATI